MIERLVRRIVEHLFWKFQEEDNWNMKMNEPIAIRKLSKEEVQKILQARRLRKSKLNIMQ
ncbi:MAG: hypothetical protein K5889_05105 [Lachnospiraceae bacterium]|nr:hypothetical protein [Lachnospiraceae bacterium]